MRNFLIRDLEHLSGIRAHTLRIWEHRYGFIKPERNDVNFRHYSVDQLELLLNAVQLNRNGHKISHLARLTKEELQSKVSLLSDSEDRKQLSLNGLLVAMYRMDTRAFDRVLEECFEQWPAREVITDIIYNFLKVTGLLFQGNRLTEEHFVITSLRQKLIKGIESARVVSNRGKTVLLFLPEGRHLDLVLLYTNYLLKLDGFPTLYMGSDVSTSNLHSVFALKKPDLIFTYLPAKHKVKVEEIAASMNQHIPDSTLVIATYIDDSPSTTLHKNVIQTNFQNALSFMAD